MKNYSLTILLLLFSLTVLIAKENNGNYKHSTDLIVASPSADNIVGLWLNQEGTAHVQISRIGSTYTGKIVWLKEPTENGRPRTDKNNPEAAKRAMPLMGLVILKDFVFDADDAEWTDGTIYDPKNGKTYSCTMTLEDGRLNVRGYIGISLIGRTAVWTRIKR
ncbi:MAG: hypothetical protein RIQ47_673 [Bacteroidota bacterium]|jgi:uncharacterized protein (DUF2147 family)